MLLPCFAQFFLQHLFICVCASTALCREMGVPSACALNYPRLCECGKHSPEPGLEYPVSLNRLFPRAQTLLMAVSLVWSTVRAHGASVCLSEKYHLFFCVTVSHAGSLWICPLVFSVILSDSGFCICMHIINSCFKTGIKYVCMVVRVYLCIWRPLLFLSLVICWGF